MKRTLLYLTLALSALSCTNELVEEQTPVQDGTLEDNLAKAVMVPLNLTVASEEAGYGVSRPSTKAGAYSVTDFWFIEFDDSGNLLIPPVYYEAGEEIAIVPPEPSTGIEYTAYVISATKGVGDNSLFTLENCATEADFKKLHYTHDDGFTNPAGDEANIGLCGKVTVDEFVGQEGHQLECVLERNVAKLKFTVANNSIVPSFRIVSVHVGNVPREFNHYVENEPVEYMDYYVNLKEDPIEPGESNEYTYYIPNNKKEAKAGAENATIKTKNDFANPGATYIEVIGADSNNTYYFTFYPGQNMENDFNLLSNHLYELAINIQTYGSLNDSRIRKLRRILFEPANSYIINPVEEDGFGFYVYGIPLKWMHKFWTTPTIFYSNTTVDFSQPANNQLVADVIWQEQNDRVIYLCDEHGIAVEDRIAFELDNDDENKGYFYFRTDGKLEGNIMIGVKRLSEADRMDVYLWSWHLWVTSYNPDQRDDAVWGGSQYTYPVTGGNIHRYSGTTWANTYTNVYIMDRNLGAMSATRTDGLAKTGGLYYQHGRKDPFPPMYEGYKLYGIDGHSDVKFDAYEGDVIKRVKNWVSFATAVKNPFAFYFSHEYYTGTSPAERASDWYNYNAGNGDQPKNRPWYNPDGNVYTKCIYDPCPPGWQVPQNGTWSDVNRVGDFQLSEPAESTGSLAGYDFSISTQGNADTAFYPAAGYRSASPTSDGTVAGAMAEYGSRGRYRVSNQVGNWTEFSSYCMQFTSSALEKSVAPRETRAHGFSVRCIQQYL